MMTSGSSNLSTRMSTQDQKRLITETALNHFISQKLKISYAIKKPFPFFESLRDQKLITEKKYKDCQEAWENMVYLPHLVYSVLSELEKTFDIPVLETLFNEFNIREYPALTRIGKSFENATQEKLCYQANDAEEREEDPNSQLSLEQGTDEDVSQNQDSSPADPSSPLGTNPHENEWPEQLCEVEQINAEETGTASDNDALESHEASEQGAQASEPAELPTCGNERCSCVMCSGSSCSGPASEPTAQGNENCTPVMCSQKAVRRGPAARTKRRKGTHSPWEGVHVQLRTGNRRKKSSVSESRRHRDATVAFSSNILPVTCGNVKGMLYKMKLKRGAIWKCIQTEDGTWLTPRQFEVKGGRAAWKNWKLSICCFGRPLRRLMEHEYLCNPPRIWGQKKRWRRSKSHNRTSSDPCPGNSDICEICRDGGTLFCCDTCSRSFHEYCHLPAVETERDPWSCTFCRIKNSAGSQWCHRESEVLARPMGPAEQLKCEFLLLQVYCHSESSFFAKIPHYYYIKEISQNLKEPMWLDKIKIRLKERYYPRVEAFVQDMRLIFQNHRASYKYIDFGLIGLRLEVEFEKIFKEVFAVQETNESSPVV
ncbi:nuclear body protein SP140-like protein isoform X2 [Saccopteryx bilineata]|uniref:nuclear body protein SP140-like protein isoform X2 n=1 Tax=Saccopteryx bilineata TaxID=59482 RepID=UPI00338E1936